MKKIVFVFVLFFIFITNIKAANNLEVGDLVKYNDIEFYVVSSKDEYYTLMKKDYLKSNEVQNLLSSTEIGNNISTEDTYIKMAYYSSDNCQGSVDLSGCTSDYSMSNVKQIVDVWSNRYLNSNDLVKDKTGYAVRLITYDEMLYNLGYELWSYSTLNAYPNSINTPSFALNEQGRYWTMSSVGDSNDEVFCSGDFIDEALVYENFLVRPVISVKKDKVTLISRNENNNLVGNKTINSKSFSKGDSIVYKGIKFYVLKDSDETKETVTLLKAFPLTIKELKKYGIDKINENAKDPGSEVKYDGFGRLAYYSSQTCGYKDLNNDITSGCTTDYDKSDIKIIVDSWSKDKFDDSLLAVDEYGYKTRLLNADDILNDMYYVPTETEITTLYSYYKKSQYTPDYNLVGCWTMSGIEDYDNYVLIRTYEEGFFPENMYIKIGTVCPVVTVNKEIIEEKEIVDIPDTHSHKLYIGFIIVGLLVVFSIIGFRLYIKVYKLKDK